MKTSSIFNLIALLVLSVTFGLSLNATVIKVPEDFSTITEAISNAKSFDTIYVSSGLFQEAITIDKPLILIGSDSTNIRISLSDGGNFYNPVISIVSDSVIIKDIFISREFWGSAENIGFGILFSGSKNCILDNVEIKASDGGLHYPGNCLKIVNSSEIQVINSKLVGGNGGWISLGARSHGTDGGNCIISNNSFKIIVNNSILIPGSRSDYVYKDGYYIKAMENSNILIENSKLKYDYFSDSTSTVTLQNITGIQKDLKSNNFVGFQLEQNYPNPFNPSTMLNYQLPMNSFVSLKIYDILGREITTLVNEFKPAGTYEVKFDAGNLTSGIYFYRIQAGSFSETKKMVLMR